MTDHLLWTQKKERHRLMLGSAFGDVITQALAEPDVMEVMLNPDGRLWLDTHSQGRIETGHVMTAQDAERIIRLIASQAGAEITPELPVLSAELPGTGERFEGLVPPLALAPCFSIRKPARVIYRLQDYVRAGVLTEEQGDYLVKVITERRNIIVVGGTGSGKTTLLNALLAEMAEQNPRIIILEDIRELQCAARDCVTLRTKPGVAALPDLVRSTLRLRPDRIVIGEVRGAEALEMLKAWNTGHPGGLSTLHANSAAGALIRLEQLIQEAVVTVPRALIAEAVDVLVFIERRGQMRKVSLIAELHGLNEQGEYCLHTPVLSPILTHEVSQTERAA